MKKRLNKTSKSPNTAPADKTNQTKPLPIALAAKSPKGTFTHHFSPGEKLVVISGNGVYTFENTIQIYIFKKAP